MKTTVPEHFSWIDGWLRLWARLNRSDKRTIHSMMKAKSPNWLGTGGASTEETFDLMADAEDRKQCALLDTVLAQLTGQHWLSIQMHYVGMEGKHRGAPQEVLNEALAVTERLAIGKGIDLGGQPVRGRVRRAA